MAPERVRFRDSISGMASEDGAVARAAGAGSDPEDRLAYATLLVEIGELYDAEAEVTEALSQRSEDVEAIDLIAKIKHLRGELSEAIAYWGQVHARCPGKETAEVRLSSLLQTARESGRGGSGEFLSLGPNHLWRKPAVYLELEEAFRLFVARQPDEARGRCDRVARKYRRSDPDTFKLAVLAKAWIAELTGEAGEARRVLEELGGERGFESDTDRLSALARLYEADGSEDLLEKAIKIYAFFEREQPRVSVLGHLAALHRRLGRLAQAERWDAAFLDLFRRRMHRPSFGDAVRIAARHYVPLYKLASARLAASPLPGRPSAREEAIAEALGGNLAAAGRLLAGGRHALDLKYRGDLAVLSGETGKAVRLYIESLEADPRSPRVVGWLLGEETAAFHRSVEAYFSRPDRGLEAVAMLEAAVRETSLRPSLWKQLATLLGIVGRPADAQRAARRASDLEEAARGRRGPVGRALAAAVYHFGGKPRGIVHEVWATRRPAEAGRGGYLEEVLGNLTPEMTQAVRNTFASVREYAQAKWPHLTRDFRDYAYSYKVTKDDEPSGGVSAGLPTALAFLSVVLDRPVPQDVASTGALVADAHDVLVVREIGEAEHKVRGACNRNLRMLLLPEGNRAGLQGSALVPGPVRDELVRFVPDFDAAARLVFGEDVFVD